MWRATETRPNKRPRQGQEKKMTYQLVICGDTESICDGYTDDRTSAWREEIAREFVGAAGRVIDDAATGGADVDYRVDSFFANWHGGKHTMFRVCGEPWGYTAGLVVCHAKHTPHAIADLCEAAYKAGAAARDEYIAQLEKEADKLEADERREHTAEVIADCRAADASK